MDGKNRAGEAGEKEKERVSERKRARGGARMTLNPTAVAPNPRYRGAKPRERELQIERTKQGRKRGDYGGRGETYRTYEEERIERGRERERKRKLETTPSRESTVPEINTPASCDHSSCHAPLLSPHISCLSHSLSFIPFPPSLSLSLSFSISFSFSLALSACPVPPFLTLRVPRSSSLW